MGTFSIPFAIDQYLSANNIANLTLKHQGSSLDAPGPKFQPKRKGNFQ